MHILHSLPRPALERSPPQPSTAQPCPAPDPSVLSVWPTYLAFVFIFSVIVLFLPSQFLRLPTPTSPPAACAHATYHLWVRSDHSLRSVFRLMLLIIITSIMTGFNWRQQRLRQLLVMKLVCHSRPGTGTGPIRAPSRPSEPPLAPSKMPQSKAACLCCTAVWPICNIIIFVIIIITIVLELIVMFISSSFLF